MLNRVEGYQAESREEVAEKLTRVNLGDRFGQLTVIDNLGLREYANRRMLFWLCRCDCGNTIELPTRKLRGQAANLLYAACEECSQKTCFLCDGRFPRKRRWDFCSSPACLEIMAKIAQDYKSSKRSERGKSDPEYHERMLWSSRDYNSRHPGKSWQYFKSLSPERQTEYRQRQAEANARYLARRVTKKHEND